MKRAIALFAALLAVACGIAATSSAKPAPARRLGAQITNEAGSPIDDAGNVAFLIDGGAIQPPLGDPPISECLVPRVTVNLIDGTGTADTLCGARRIAVPIQIGPAVLNGIVTQVKNQEQAYLGVTFQ